MLYEEAKKKIEEIYAVASAKLRDIAVLQEKILKKEGEKESIKKLQDKLKN